jgi:predicted acylesterase/phospholipase RssA
MQRIGLALSGGGFRATLYHLGMIRLLREANILPSVTHITSVSGGSILAAHLVLHWHRYTGSLEDFDAAAAEVIRFVQLDVRNRVVRRYPLAMPWRALRRLTLLGPSRRLTRTGLLEYHYEQYLYGNTCLFQLPERPRLFILATNLSEGCLCAFTREGLLVQRRQPGKRFRFDRLHTGLATVPMAVTASSAFPGFFPTLELRGQDVGADPGQFGRIVFTDGGIYDNLGVRMFRCLEQSWMAREIGLHADDLVNAQEIDSILAGAAHSQEESPLRRLAERIARSGGAAQRTQGADEPVARLLVGLWDVMQHENLAREPGFAGLSPPDPDAVPLLRSAQDNGGEVDAGEQLWLNRQLVDAAFRQATGKPCFRSLNSCFDGVLVSDAGKQFKISADTRAGGVITTAMRSTDIVMDRVWQLEVDTFRGTSGFVFAPIGNVVQRDEDPTAIHPEMQRMVVDIRTDLDRFSPLEISALIRHGYCVGRSVCRRRPDLFGTDIPTGPPWDPLQSSNEKSTPADAKGTPTKSTPPTEAERARLLQHSAGRRIWSRLLDYRDWISYVYVPLIVPILVVLPYYGAKWYRQSHIDQRLIESMAKSNSDYAFLKTLLQYGPTGPFTGLKPEEISELAPADYKGIEVLSDTRILDLRTWAPATGDASDERSWGHGYRRVRVQKLEPTANRFVALLHSDTLRWEVRPRTDRVPMSLRLLRDPAIKGVKQHVFEVEFDLSKVPVHKVVDLSFEYLVRKPRPETVRAVDFYTDAPTGLLNLWLLMPDDFPLKSLEVMTYPSGKGLVPEPVVPAQQLTLLDGRIVSFSLAGTKGGATYECQVKIGD